MDFPAPLLLFAAGAAVVGVLAYFSHLAERGRTQELSAVAARLGWRFAPDRDTTLLAVGPPFEVFHRGHSRYAHNTMHGSLTLLGAPCRALLGDYHYKTTSGAGKNRSTKTHRLSYLLVDSPRLEGLGLGLRPEGVFDKLSAAFGFDDIDFESAEFSRRFHVKSPDKRLAYDVFHPPMMEWLLETPGLTLQVAHGACLVWDGNRRWEPAEFHRALDWTQRFFDLWPEHVVASLPAGRVAQGGG